MFLTIFNNPLPVAELVDKTTEWLTKTFSGLFGLVQDLGNAVMNVMTDTLLFFPPILVIVLLTGLAYLLSRKKTPKAFGLALFTFIGLLFIDNQGLWVDLMNTLSLVVVASILSVIIGIPLGIWMAKSNRVQQIVNPILDFMQTMPAFVYLIPAVAFFGIGMVPGVFASIIFALPPTVRFTNLGIREVPRDLVEASESFGSTGQQKLFKVELPLAKDTIVAGVSQTIMLALSMVVTGSMIGAPGLGRGVLSALQKADIGSGFVNGLSLVILAIIIDRMMQLVNVKSQNPLPPLLKKALSGLALVLLLLPSFASFLGNSKAAKKDTINLAYVQWDSEIASTNVLAEVLRQEGFEVEMMPLDNAVVWKSLADGSMDASVSAWLPVTHGDLFAEYKGKLEDLGPNLEGVALGLAVPTYMAVDSIEDLTSQANNAITGIEPGAGIMASADNALSAYANLSSWTLEPASTGAMVTALDKAIKGQEDIVITAWSPHWMFAKYDLKYLEDPQKVFGDGENIHTLTRQGLAEDKPEAFQIIDQFYWTKEDMEAVMLDIADGMSEEEAARKWIEANPNKVAEWTKS
ncbi:ABC transporter permease/substrate binding protein [Streptococcus merionis]|uniref:ABC transporter permease/substrate binding protein n=1 Tax=Streptococcus merionis TaxID=400065 RepID=UPI003519B658